MALLTLRSQFHRNFNPETRLDQSLDDGSSANNEDWELDPHEGQLDGLEDVQSDVEGLAAAKGLVDSEDEGGGTPDTESDSESDPEGDCDSAAKGRL